MNKVKSAFITCILACILSGCTNSQKYENVQQICFSNLTKQQAMYMAEEVLGKMHFEINKADIEHGYIKSQPLAAAQVFEFWRKDNAGAFNSAEANLHTVRRIAELNIQEQNNQLCVTCNVNTQRLSMPEREITSSSQMSGMFVKPKGSLQRLKLYSDQKKAMAWLSLGNDERLAAKILKQIKKKIEQ